MSEPFTNKKAAGLSQLIRGQFRLSWLLIAITVCALAVGWLVRTPPGYISEAQLNRVVEGLPRSSLSKMLGEPLLKEDGWQGHQVWQYRLKGAYPWSRDPRFLMVMFDSNDKVSQVVVASPR